MGKFRDHKIEEKRKLRNARQKRKRKQRSAERKASGSVKLQQANEDRLKEVIKLRTIARVYCCKWRDKCAENQRLKDSLQKSYHRTPAVQEKLSFNNICPNELLPVHKAGFLGEGSFGQCFIRNYARLNIPVVEKQMSRSSVGEIINEAQIMQLLSHPNIPTILGVQCEKAPFSIIMQFIGHDHSSSTVHDLLGQDDNLHKRDWVKISLNITDALAHVHKKGYLHCDLKSNNVLVSNGAGYLIDFGKACQLALPSAKRYNKIYPHLAPEVLHGSPCSKQSDVYSLGTVLYKIGKRRQISTLSNIAKKCLDKDPNQRMTLTGIMATLTTQNEIPLI